MFSTLPLLSKEVEGEPDFAKQGGLKMESVSEILAKKLRLRMYVNVECLARDCHDLVIVAESNLKPLGVHFHACEGIRRKNWLMSLI